jgi:light-regulated signal transduction histidine kinase (bacteriophytochrome)
MPRYVLSALLPGAATLLTFAVQPLLGGKATLIFFAIAVAMSAAYGGLWPGLITTLLSVFAAGLLFQNSTYLLAQSQSSLVLFAVLGVTISAIIHLLHRANANVVTARTQLERANQQLSERTEALSRSNEELRQFAYALSHDLQAPLRNIGTLTALLVRRNNEILDKDSKEYAQLIVAGVQRMESMIKGLLDYTTAAVDTQDRAVSNSNTVFEKVLHNLRYLIDAEGAVVTCDELPIVQANDDRLAQVFSNLITNAIKYRGNRKPKIHVTATDNGTEWIFKVQDNGIGIDMKHADEIFVLFKRLPGSEERDGSGIGLAVCKTVIERFGGQIWVESEPDKGSTFFFTIPKITSASLKPLGQAVTESLVRSRNAGAS